MDTSLPKSTISTFRRVTLHMLRFLSVCVGSLLTSVVPVEIWADGRRVENMATGYMPNMDPGVVVVIALFFTLPILAAVLLVELIRWWAMGHEPLALPSCLALGVLAAWPIGYSFAISEAPLGYPLVLLVASLGVVVFYSVRWAWLANRASTTGASRK